MAWVKKLVHYTGKKRKALLHPCPMVYVRRSNKLVKVLAHRFWFVDCTFREKRSACTAPLIKDLGTVSAGHDPYMINIMSVITLAGTTSWGGIKPCVYSPAYTRGQCLRRGFWQRFSLRVVSLSTCGLLWYQTQTRMHSVAPRLCKLTAVTERGQTARHIEDDGEIDNDN